MLTGEIISFLYVVQAGVFFLRIFYFFILYFMYKTLALNTGFNIVLVQAYAHCMKGN